jgi:acetyl-CoA acyltransferase
MTNAKNNQVQDAYIVKAIRTPVGKYRGMFSNVRPDDLLAHCLKSVVKEQPELASRAEDVIVGCAMPEAEQGMNVARIGLLLAGFPDNVPGITINRFCSSGSQAVAMAADRIRLGEADVMIAAGTESMSMVPMMGNKISLNPKVFSEENVAIAYGMGITAERVAEKWKVSREDQDAFAVQSHQRAILATEQGLFANEIEPYTIDSSALDESKMQIVSNSYEALNDEGPRASSVETLAGLRTVFQSDGSVTAANSSQMSDGAGAVLLVSEKILKEYNLEPIGRFVTSAVAGVEPQYMGIGPKEAIPMCLKRAGLAQSDMDWIELNEAFAAQALAVMRDLDLDPNKVNPRGGAIALGHPLGATGAIRTATLMNGLSSTGGRYGMVTMCIGTGMGFAMIVENYVK